MSLEFIKCLNRCRLHKNEPEFTDMVLNGYKSPGFLKIEERGDAYPGMTIYEINEFGCNNGFFSEVLFVLKELIYADMHGFIPYVNWGNNFLYHDNSGATNSFLQYFDQVSEVSDTSKASFVIVSKDEHINWVCDRFGCHSYEFTKEYSDELTNMAKKYLSYSASLKEELDEAFIKLTEGKKTLAVHFRGTDYRRQYNNHPVFVSVEEELEEAKKFFFEKKYERIFLATDETEATELFEKEFKDKLVFFKDVHRAGKKDDSVAFSKNDKPGIKDQLGYEVVRDQYVLTRCSGLICGVSNLTIASRILRNAWFDTPYDDLLVIDHGFNHNDNSFSKALH